MTFSNDSRHSLELDSTAFWLGEELSAAMAFSSNQLDETRAEVRLKLLAEHRCKSKLQNSVDDSMLVTELKLFARVFKFNSLEVKLMSDSVDSALSLSTTGFSDAIGLTFCV